MPGMPDPLAEALERVGDRWTLAVVQALLDGPRRFSELTAAVEGIAPNTLADRLRRLERDGLLVARPYCERPPRHAYELTDEGRALQPAIAALAAWGDRRAADGDVDEPPIRL
jgi:DNA-binding HxlR family transcriptional regulator